MKALLSIIVFVFCMHTSFAQQKDSKTIHQKDTTVQIKNSTAVGNATSKQELSSGIAKVQKPTQTGKFRNQSPSIADTAAISKQAPAYKAKKVLLSNQKEPAMK